VLIGGGDTSKALVMPRRSFGGAFFGRYFAFSRASSYTYLQLQENNKKIRQIVKISVDRKK